MLSSRPRRMTSLAAVRLIVPLLASVCPPASTSARLLAADSAAAAPYECRWSDEPIVIDGRADETAWRHAQMIDKFSLPWLRDKERPAKTATRARLLWDREHVYFFADMEDHDLFADVHEHDGRAWTNDVFELFFKPADDKPGYYEFEINAAGAVLDMFIPQRIKDLYERHKADGEFHIEAAVQRRGTLDDRQDRDEGWSIEGRIPWTDFLRTGGRPAIGETWKFALCRYDYAIHAGQPELSTSAPLRSSTEPNFHAYEDYAPLRFVGPQSAPAGLVRAAWTTSRVVGSPDPPLPYRVRQEYEQLKVPAPLAVAHEPGTNDLIVVYQLSSGGGAGRIARFKDDPQADKLDELLRLDGIAYGIAFDPDYERNGHLYVGSNEPLGKPTCTTRVTRYTVDRQEPRRVLPGSAKLIIEWPSNGHNGGDLAFGVDGMLYVSSGDGTSDSDTNLRGQDLTELTAKVLRIDVHHPADGRAYAVPKDNPFVDMSGVRPETWAYGLRNPWRLSIDHRTGNVWVGNNGQDLWEQVYLVRKGENYGWSVTEGSHPFYPNRERGPTPITPPTSEHSHAEARSLTGGCVYYGEKFPDLQGAYIYGDYSTGKIWGLHHDGRRVVWRRELADTVLQISGFGIDSNGELLILDYGGGFYRLEPAPSKAPTEPFPTRLSETGVFAFVPEHRVQPGLVPYSVNSPLWSDGAYKERYFGIPQATGEKQRIGFTPQGAWQFPDGTVLVKSFALETIEGDPASRRWIETRLLTRQQGEWVGYSYAWNEQQTDAELVAAGGADRDFAIAGKDQAKGRVQPWRYPSRAECMTCHSRAAGFVLGLSTLQMNKPHAYGDMIDNQLQALERAGLLRVDWVAEAKQAVRQEAAARGLQGPELNAYLARQFASQGQRQPTSTEMLFQSPSAYASLADPYDDRLELGVRARSYLHVNCAQCHVQAGGGNAKIDVSFSTPAQKTNLFDAAPQHHTFGISEARIVAPGSPEQSVLYRRMQMRAAGQMPPLATSRVDEQALRLLHDWIEQLPPAAPAAR